MTMPSILFILHLPPPVHGAAMVGKYIHDSELINSEFDCHYINLTTASSLEDIGHVGWGKVKAFWQLLRKIRQAVREMKPEMVYVTPNAKGGAFYKDFIVVEMLKRMGCRVVVHFHNKGVASRQGRWMDNLLYRRFFHGIKVILLAEALYEDVSKYVKKEDVYICPNGIPVEESVDNGMKSGANATPRLLFLSNLLIDKGVLVLLDALTILKEKGCPFVCNFIGGETADIDASRFEEEVEKRGLGQHAFYKGRKYGEEKSEEFANADVFVFPTFYHNECFPLVLLEAMQHRLPVVTTDVGGIAAIMDNGKTGFLVTCNDEQAVAEKVERLLTDETLRNEMGQAGRKKFEEEFTLEKFEHRLCDILSLINRSMPC